MSYHDENFCNLFQVQGKVKIVEFRVKSPHIDFMHTLIKDIQNLHKNRHLMEHRMHVMTPVTIRGLHIQVIAAVLSYFEVFNRIQFPPLTKSTLQSSLEVV